MDVPLQVPVDDPDADTEWNDILRKHGIIPEKPPSPTPIIEEALLEAARRAHENRLEDKDLDELDELEDDEDAEFLAKYRYDRELLKFVYQAKKFSEQRMNELATLAKSGVFGQVYGLQKPDYSRDVTEASNKAFVLVNLTSSLGTNLESQVLTEIWRQLAQVFAEVKFCEMRADLCIEGYPERNTPTILVYKDRDIKKQLITLRELGGERTTLEDLRRLLVEVGAVKATDHRVTQRNEPEASKSQDEDDKYGIWD